MEASRKPSVPQTSSEAAAPVVAQKDTPKRIPSDHQFILDRAKPQLEALRQQVATENRNRPKPLSRKALLSKLRNDHAVAIEDIEQSHAHASLFGENAVLTAAQKQAEDKARKQAIEEQQAAVLRFLNEQADALLVRQHSEERERKQAIELQRQAIIEKVRLESADALRDLARQREAEAQAQRAAREAEKQRHQPSDRSPEGHASRLKPGHIPSEADFIRLKAEPIKAARLANGQSVNIRALNRQLRTEYADELKDLARQREAQKEQRRLELAAANEQALALSRPQRAQARIQSEAAFLEEKAAPIQAAAEAAGEHVSKRTLYRELRIQYSAELQQLAEQREADKLQRKLMREGATPLEPKSADIPTAPKPKAEPKPLTRAQIKRQEAAARRAAEVEANAAARRPKETSRIPSERTVLRDWARPIVAEAKERGEFRTLAGVMRELQVTRADELAALRQRRQEAADRQMQEHQERLTRPRDDVRVRRHSFEVTEHGVPQVEKKADKRRLKREQRRQEEEAANAIKLPKLGAASDYITAAEAHLERGDQAMAGRLLFKAADQLGTNDPERLKVAAAMQKAKGPDMAARVLQPMVDADGSNAGPALAFMSALRLSRGGSRAAFEILTKHDREELKPLKAAAQLSLAMRTDDPGQCDAAMAQLGNARFVHRDGALVVDLSAYAGQMQPQIRLTASTLKYATVLGEALVRTNRLHEAVRLYDTLRPVQPSCSSERRDYIRALKSCGNAYHQYGVACRHALGELAVPHAPTQAWSQAHERTAMAETADKYLNASFGRLFEAFRLDGTDQALRQQLVKVVELTGNPDQFEQLNGRVHRRAKQLAELERMPDDAALLAKLQKMGEQEELSPEQRRLLRELGRNRQAALSIEQQRQVLLEQITVPREDTDKPAHRPSALARWGRPAPRR